ncbi:MAG: endonuclease III domain-containing protein [Pseudomonadota bacterium]|nr:endonuclease III domain-containing protein [Pseudomonadota bacterium]
MHAVFRALLAAHGPQHWWPADSPFEVMVGAILTQNTSWTNVTRALAGLRDRISLDARAILSLPTEELAKGIRPAGYFNVKAQRLQAFCRGYLESGGFERLSRLQTPELRRWLLAIHGVGPETADDILLYAFERPVFVVDAYTRRVFTRLGLLEGGEGYEAIRHRLEASLGPDTGLFNEYHALIVRHGKQTCRGRPLCDGCCLTGVCPFPPSAVPTESRRQRTPPP